MTDDIISLVVTFGASLLSVAGVVISTQMTRRAEVKQAFNLRYADCYVRFTRGFAELCYAEYYGSSDRAAVFAFVTVCEELKVFCKESVQNTLNELIEDVILYGRDEGHTDELRREVLFRRVQKSVGTDLRKRFKENHRKGRSLLSNKHSDQ